MEKMVVKSNDIVRNVYILDGRSGCCSDAVSYTHLTLPTNVNV